MSRTLNGNLTGVAAHGIDELEVPPSEYAQRLEVAGKKVEAIIEDKWSYLDLILHVKEGTLLDILETIVAQCEAWNEIHPVEEAVELEKVIDAQLPYTRVFNSYLAGGVRYPEPAEVKAQADAVCVEYEAKYVDVTKNFNGIKATATNTWAERHLNKEADAA